MANSWLEVSLLDREELAYELSLRDTEVSADDTLEDLVANLQGLTLAEAQSSPRTPQRQMSNPGESVNEIVACGRGLGALSRSVKAVITCQSRACIEVKLWHYARRIQLITVSDDTDRQLVQALQQRLSEIRSTFLAKSGFLRAETLSPNMRTNQHQFRNIDADTLPVYKWKLQFDGRRRDVTSVFNFLQDVQDQMEIANVSEQDVVRGIKYLLTGPAREWYRLVQDRVHSWADFCESLQKEFIPRDYVETALDDLKAWVSKGSGTGI